MPWWLLALLFVPSGRKGKPAAVESSSQFAGFAAGDVLGALFERPLPVWRVTRGSKVLAQGTAPTTGELLRPMLEAFAAATVAQAITAWFNEGDRVLTIAVFPIASADGSVDAWGWTLTDGVQAVSGTQERTRGAALLAAMDRAREGGG